MHHFAEIGYALAVLALFCLISGVASSFSRQLGAWRVPKGLEKHRGGG